jgi:transcriptional regulator with XRE-family HTH domain
MNVIANYVDAVGSIPLLQTAAISPAPKRPLHRLREVRQREGLSRCRVARLLGISIREVEQQEQPSTDMLLSDLQRWKKALGVPVTDLLDDSNDELSPLVHLRARLLRVMKTVRTIQERARQASMQRLATMLADQLVEVMPELKDITAWPLEGKGRRDRDYGQAFYRRLTVQPLEEPDSLDG